jgi:hypothetical protein
MESDPIAIIAGVTFLMIFLGGHLLALYLLNRDTFFKRETWRWNG